MRVVLVVGSITSLGLAVGLAVFLVVLKRGAGGAGGSGEGAPSSRHLSRALKGIGFIKDRFNPHRVVPSNEDDYEGGGGAASQADGMMGGSGGLEPAIARRVDAWAEGKDVYDMLASLKSLGLDGDEEGGEAEEEEEVDEEGRQGGLSRDSATVDALRTAWHKASQSLQPDRLAELPENKRAVALELYRVLSAAYEAECIVLEECSKAAERALK